MTPNGLQVFLSMGGYAFYVWTSYAVVALAIVIEIIATRARLRTAIKSASPSGRAAVLQDDTQ